MKKNKYKEPTLKELIEHMEKMRDKGIKPNLKGYKGRVKFEFE